MAFGTLIGLHAHGAIGETDLRRAARRSELRSAIDRGEIKFHYHPIAEAHSGAIVAIEALARWQHPQRGLLRPDEFLSLAEGDRRTMWALTMHAIASSLSDAQALAQDEPPMVWVNISSAHTREPLAREVAAALAENGFAPGRLGIEVTETAVMEDPESSGAVLSQIRELGVAIALDDFGTGHSSVARLASLPIDVVKVDHRAIAGAAHGRAENVLLRATVEFAHALELEVVAEGVENERAWSTLREVGCDRIQGDALSRPLPVHELSRWLGKRTASAP